VVKAEVMMRPDGKSKGCAIVEYADINAAARALNSLNGVELRGRPVYVRDDREAGKPMHVVRQGGPGTGGAGAGSPHAHLAPSFPAPSSSANYTAGICYAFKQGGSVHGDSCKFRHDTTQPLNADGNEVIYLATPRLYVSNLAWNVSWQDLKGLFRRVSRESSELRALCSCSRAGLVWLLSTCHPVTPTLCVMSCDVIKYDMM
jgi:hypothetical protein